MARKVQGFIIITKHYRLDLLWATIEAISLNLLYNISYDINDQSGSLVIKRNILISYYPFDLNL